MFGFRLQDFRRAPTLRSASARPVHLRRLRPVEESPENRSRPRPRKTVDSAAASSFSWCFRRARRW